MDISDFLLTTYKNANDVPQLLNRIAELLIASNISPQRINLVVGALHPEILIKLYIWRKEKGHVDTSKQAQVFDFIEREFPNGIVKEIYLGNSTFQNPAFLVSPQNKIIFENQNFIHQYLEKDISNTKFPIMNEFKADGGTAYIALPIMFNSGVRSCITLLVNKTGGFSDKNIDDIKDLVELISPLLEILESRRLTDSLMKLYLGDQASNFVLNGTIKRGDVHALKAAIWFCDIRQYTHISTLLKPDQLIEFINTYFEFVEQSISPLGGQILKFIGDAVLVVFPQNDKYNKTQVCVNAFNAAVALSNLVKLNQDKIIEKFGVQLKQGVGLHYGTVKFGNIGTQQRLDFTVIGDAVNVTSRIESLCSKIEKDILVSSLIYEQINKKDFKLISHGKHQLKGVSEVIEIYSL